MKSIMSFLAFGVFICIGLTSCNISPSSSSAWVVLVDETEYQEFDVEAITSFILEKSDMDTMTFFKGSISVSISPLNEKVTNKVNHISLEKGGSMFSEITQDRLDKQTIFHHALSESLHTAYSFSRERPVSKLYQPICQKLNRLATVKADKKYCLILSDGLENSNQYSFYKFKSKPHLFAEHSDEIAEVFRSQCTLTDLSNIEVIIIHEPDATHDDLFQSAKEFWLSFLSEQGCNVSFRANL